MEAREKMVRTTPTTTIEAPVPSERHLENSSYQRACARDRSRRCTSFAANLLNKSMMVIVLAHFTDEKTEA